MKIYVCENCGEWYEQQPLPHCEICGENAFTEIEQEEIK